MRISFTLAVVMTFIMSVLSLAQNTARVTGTAFTPYELSEALVPGVRLVFTAGDVKREVVTDQQGRYEIGLPEGVYQLSGGLAGFCKINRSNLSIRTNTETLINVRLIVCGIADGAEVDKNGKVIREIEWLLTPLKTESLTFKTDRGSERQVLVEFASRTDSDQITVYKGTVEGRNNISASIVYGTMAIYADSLVMDKNDLSLRASGNVVVENGRMRLRATEASLNLRAADLAGSLVMGGEVK
jgi:hypothetical protein